MSTAFTRREWTQGVFGLASASELAAAWQHAHQTASGSTAPKLEHLDAALAAEIEAITSEIIPSDDSPGAREAGVIFFIDRALATWESDKRDSYRTGMQDVQKLRREMFPASQSIAALSGGDRIKLITAFERTEFFALLRTHTALGFYGSPTYGGNRGKVGWAHMGLEDKMMFEPPFGYYDAEAMKEGQR